MLKELQALGLQKNEAMVYEAVLKNGPCRAALIITKLALHRNLVYRALDNLVDEGYVTKFTQNGVWQFQITDPHMLLTNMRRREKMFNAVLEKIASHQRSASQQFMVYKGQDSYQRYWLRAIEQAPVGVVGYVAGGELALWQQHMGKQLPAYLRIARDKQLIWKVIFFTTEQQNVDLLDQSTITYESRTASTIIPGLPGNFNIFNDTVIIHVFEPEPYIIELRDANILKLFAAYFETMWESAV